MNNPFKIVGMAVLICLCFMLAGESLQGIMGQILSSEWLLLVSFAFVLLIATLVQTLRLSNLIQQSQRNK